MYSDATQVKTQIIVTTSALIPKNMHPATRAGIRAIITSSIIDETVSLPSI
jgi:hypothetical protein